ncbi:hypothetical protein ACFQ1M_08900 [Sungkyunkwania multivorans]|uniref:DinB family protein n=1 Tax=Sungkyunkwania multivorans TaxID=1173618 RepID=A0ABW3CXD3_9FLAO
MNQILAATISTLSKSKDLLQHLKDEQLCDASVSPYYSCVGSHIRHILDFYDCIIHGLPNELIDLTARKRDLRVQEDCAYAISNVERILKSLENIEYEADKRLAVVDDLGQGKMTVNYTLGALLAQANSHTIHHYAIINYILDALNIAFDDQSFGYNPTTPVGFTSN